MPIKEFVKRVIDAEWVARVIEVLDRGSDNRMTELGMLGQAFEFAKINQVPGDYLEVGLWPGKTFSYAYRMMHRYRRGDMKLWGFDSFQGLPDTGDRPDVAPRTRRCASVLSPRTLGEGLTSRRSIVLQCVPAQNWNGALCLILLNLRGRRRKAPCPTGLRSLSFSTRGWYQFESGQSPST